MIKQLKVYGGCFDGRNRLIASAKSFAEYVRLVNNSNVGLGWAYSYTSMKQHSSETGNEEEIKIALSSPGTVFSTILQYPHKYKPISKK